MTTSTRERILEAAAEERGKQVRGRGDRPSQRRCNELPGALPIARVRAPKLEIRAAAAAGQLHFEGFASVYDRGYEMWDMFGPYVEQVSSGAGAKSLANPELDVPLVLAHDSLRRIARTTNGSLALEEKTIDVAGEEVSGLHVDAPSLDARDGDVAYIVPKLEAGLVDEMSFRFMITSGEWSPSWDEFHIKEYEIDRGDVAIVGYGANPFTAGSGLRSLPALDELTDADLRALERRMHLERQRRDGTVPPAPAPGPARPVLSRAQISALATE